MCSIGGVCQTLRVDFMGIRKNCRRDWFGPAETIQRVRPQEARASIANRRAYRFTQCGIECVAESSHDLSEEAYSTTDHGAERMAELTVSIQLAPGSAW